MLSPLDGDPAAIPGVLYECGFDPLGSTSLAGLPRSLVMRSAQFLSQKPAWVSRFSGADYQAVDKYMVAVLLA